MGYKARPLKLREIKKILKYYDCEPDRESKETVWIRITPKKNHTISIPKGSGGKDIPRGTCENIRKLAGLSKKEFWE